METAVVWHRAVRAVGRLFGRRQRGRARRRLDARRRFESLVADLASAFVEIPAHEIDQRIAEGLLRTIDELGVDRVGLGEFVPATGDLRVTHIRTRDGLAPPPPVYMLADWPWTLARVRAGNEIRIARLTDLPAEAERDRTSYMALGTHAIVLLPLRVGGTVLGSLACSMQRDREWASELVHQLRALADLFTVVLMRKRAEQALEASESRFHQLVDAAPVLMWVAGADGRCVDVNRAWLHFTGRTLAEQLGDGWLESVHPEDRASCGETYRTALAAREPFTMEYRLRRADGTYRAVFDSGVPILDGGQGFQGYVGSAVDVTEVKRAQQSLVDSLALRSAIFGSLYGQVAAVDADGIIIAVNEGWTSSLRERGGDVDTGGVGVNYLDVCRRAVATGDTHAEAALDALESVRAGTTSRATLEYPCETPSGPEWFTMVAEPLRRPEGGLVVSHINVTRRRLAEEQVQREREELAHALRVATLGGLATSLAHEINQPLAAIASNAEAARLLVTRADVDPDVTAALQDISDAAQRAAQIIRRLRVLFKKQQSEPHPLDVVDVIEEIVSLLRKELENRRVRVNLSLPSGLPRVLADVVQLQQVLLNVFVNASEAMTGAAHPRELTVVARMREPATVAVTIADTGHAVAAGELEHIFERFVTSKPDGLGMGLPISRSIIEAHGGRMWATRNPGRGLTIHIELPSLES